MTGADGTVRVGWLGHATVAVTDGATTVLTDPVLTSRVGHLRRRRGPDPTADLPRPDVVLLSHLHADHTHVPSLRLLGAVPIVVPRGAVGAFGGLREFGDRVIELLPGEETVVGTVTVRAVPADHDGRRWPRGPHGAPALGYVVEGSVTTYFAGDTALHPAMAEWVPRCDLALLPVGGWGPSLGPGHMDPEGAARAAELVSAAVSVPVHFGTLWPIGLDAVRPRRFFGPGGEFVRRAAASGLDAVELSPGGRLPLR
ncbi:MBL fold metallo-hydrolase [Rhodococcus olei]|uniref:MBL fold metallo-hydrolase n=1 Tax=Rhodococcus olei TaxID=2161675 RepID=A0ABP8PM32_9NOCA